MELRVALWEYEIIEDSRYSKCGCRGRWKRLDVKIKKVIKRFCKSDKEEENTGNSKKEKREQGRTLAKKLAKLVAVPERMLEDKTIRGKKPLSVLM